MLHRAAFAAWHPPHTDHDGRLGPGPITIPSAVTATLCPARLTAPPIFDGSEESVSYGSGCFCCALGTATTAQHVLRRGFMFCECVLQVRWRGLSHRCVLAVGKSRDASHQSLSLCSNGMSWPPPHACARRGRYTFRRRQDQIWGRRLVREMRWHGGPKIGAFLVRISGFNVKPEKRRGFTTSQQQHHL